MRPHAFLLVAILACRPAPLDLSLDVYSGRPQPPPETTNVRVGTEVKLHLQGLGPPKARVIAPDGRETHDPSFIANAPGQWRIELEGAPGVVLAYVNAS